VKRLPWRTILVSVAVSLMLAGVAPLVYLSWWGAVHKLEALSVPLPLQRGKYTSPVFTTDLDDEYQIEVYFLPWNRTPLDLDWKIVDDRGAVLESGTYRDQQVGGNTVVLGHYRPQRRSPQRVIVNMHSDAVQAASPDLKLHIGLPERGLEQAYGLAAAIGWALLIAGSGAIMLLILLIQRVLRSDTPPPIRSTQTDPRPGSGT
jgi:hypothetical protein